MDNGGRFYRPSPVLGRLDFRWCSDPWRRHQVALRRRRGCARLTQSSGSASGCSCCYLVNSRCRACQPGRLVSPGQQAQQCHCWRIPLHCIVQEADKGQAQSQTSRACACHGNTRQGLGQPLRQQRGGCYHRWPPSGIHRSRDGGDPQDEWACNAPRGDPGFHRRQRFEGVCSFGLARRL